MGHGGTTMRTVLGCTMAASVALGSRPTTRHEERSGDLTTNEHSLQKVVEDRLRQDLPMCQEAGRHERILPSIFPIIPEITASSWDIGRRTRIVIHGEIWLQKSPKRNKNRNRNRIKNM
jgi:hypothetical protein